MLNQHNLDQLFFFPPPPPLQPSLKKEFVRGLGDVCHACKKRVFVVERLSAEGFHFHRECFRCHTCRAPLRQGGHSFDLEEGNVKDL